jgi:hypothetical protein
MKQGIAIAAALFAYWHSFRHEKRSQRQFSRKPMIATVGH